MEGVDPPPSPPYKSLFHPNKLNKKGGALQSCLFAAFLKQAKKIKKVVLNSLAAGKRIENEILLDSFPELPRRVGLIKTLRNSSKGCRAQ